MHHIFLYKCRNISLAAQICFKCDFVVLLIAHNARVYLISYILFWNVNLEQSKTPAEAESLRTVRILA